MRKLFAFLQAHRWLRDSLLGIFLVALTVFAISFVYELLNNSELSIQVSFAIATLLITGATLFITFVVVIINLFIKKPKAKNAAIKSAAKQTAAKPIEKPPVKPSPAKAEAITPEPVKPKKKEPVKKPSQKKALPAKIVNLTTPKPKAVEKEELVKKQPPPARRATKIDIKKLKKAPIVRLYIDFDGTLTSKPGEQLVTHPVYDKLTLMDGYSIMLEDPDAVSIKAILSNLKELDEGETNYISISKDAINFITDLLKQGDDIDINIISKNHASYIKAIMKFHHIDPEQLSIVGISELMKFNSKGEALQKIEKLKQKPAECLFIFDDNEKDASSLLQGALGAGYDDEDIHLHKRQPGCFEWEDYRKDVLEKMAYSKSEKESDE